MAYHEDVFKARRNGRGSGQFVNGRPINVDQLIALLEQSSAATRHPAIRKNANRLLEWMASHSWRISAGPHQGGRGDARGADWTTHVTVQIMGMGSYHLRMDARGHLFEITGNGLVPIPPYATPGTPL